MFINHIILCSGVIHTVLFTQILWEYSWISHNGIIPLIFRKNILSSFMYQIKRLVCNARTMKIMAKLWFFPKIPICFSCYIHQRYQINNINLFVAMIWFILFVEKVTRWSHDFFRSTFVCRSFIENTSTLKAATANNLSLWGSIYFFQIFLTGNSNFCEGFKY